MLHFLTKLITHPGNSNFKFGQTFSKQNQHLSEKSISFFLPDGTILNKYHCIFGSSGHVICSFFVYSYFVDFCINDNYFSFYKEILDEKRNIFLYAWLLCFYAPPNRELRELPNEGVWTKLGPSYERVKNLFRKKSGWRFFLKDLGAENFFTIAIFMRTKSKLYWVKWLGWYVQWRMILINQYIVCTKRLILILVFLKILR